MPDSNDHMGGDGDRGIDAWTNGAMDVTKPYEFIGFGAMDVTKPCEFIGFGAMDVTKPCEFIGFGAISGRILRSFGGPLSSAEWKGQRASDGI